MGKGARKRDFQTEMKSQKIQEQQKLAKKKKLYKRLGIAGVALAAVIAIGIVGYGSLSASGYFIRHTISASSTSYKINNSMISYFFNNTYHTYVNNNSSSSIDTTKSLKSQTYSGTETWYDYFMQSTQSNLKQMIIMDEAAKAAGVALDKDDETKIDESITKMEKTAKENNQSVKAYITSVYGKGVSEDDIRECLELNALSTKYYQTVYNGFSYTDTEINSYYKENKNTFDYINYKSYTFTSDIPSDATDSQKTTINAATKATAEKLAACKTPADFDSYLTSYLKATYKDSSKTAKEITDIIAVKVKSTLTEDATYDSSNSFSTWAYDSSRKVNATTVIEGTNAYTVYMLTSLPARQEYTTKSVRHILFTADTYGTSDAAKAKAQEIEKEYLAGNKTEDAFAALATKYSEDTGTKGGLYKDITKGTMVASFENWCYDSSRKPGDVAIVQSSYGYHLMYFVGDGVPAWKSEIIDAKKSADYNTKYTAFSTKYAVTFNTTNLNKISA